MYVAIVGGGRGSAKKYVLVKESFRDEQGRPRSRTVQNLGPLDALLEKDPQALEKLRARFQSDREAKRTTAAAVRAERLRAQLGSVEDSHLPMPVLRYGHFPLRRIWTKDLQLDVKIRNLQAKSARAFDLNAALFFLTFTKVLDPTDSTSRARTNSSETRRRTSRSTNSDRHSTFAQAPRTNSSVG